MSLPLGQVLDGKYRIVRLIGEGGMGSVYEGENTRIRRRVAIKVLHAGVAANNEMVQRFEREAQVAGTVGNDHILEILDLGALPGGERYMVMEFLDGETLTDRIKSRGRLPPAEALVLLRQILAGLSAAHAAGIVHRDLKPDNIFILKQKAGTRDYVKIIDFGISKFSEHAGASSRMTRTGALMGTPHYMAPEQATGSSGIDRRTDLYAVGIIFYEAVTGRVPFQAETFNQLLFEIALAKITPASQIVPSLEPSIDTIILKASARDPAHRFQTADEFMAAIDEWQKSGKSVSLPPEQSIEAIVAATVPRTGQFASSSDISASGIAPVTVPDPVKSSVSSVSAPDTQVSPTPRTLNTWANSQPDLPKSKAPLIVATAVGMLLLAGGATAAYLAFRAPPDSPTPAASVPAPPSAEAPAPAVTAEAPAAESTAAPEASAAPSVVPKVEAAASPSTATAKKAIAAGGARRPASGSSKSGKPAEPPVAPAKKKSGINFGY